MAFTTEGPEKLTRVFLDGLLSYLAFFSFFLFFFWTLRFITLVQRAAPKISLSKAMVSCLTAYPAEIVYFSSTQRELSNVIQLAELQ